MLDTIYYDFISFDLKQHAVIPDTKTVFRKGIRQMLNIPRQIILQSLYFPNIRFTSTCGILRKSLMERGLNSTK